MTSYHLDGPTVYNEIVRLPSKINCESRKSICNRHLMGVKREASSDGKQRSGFECPIQIATKHWLKRLWFWGNNQVLVREWLCHNVLWPCISPYKSYSQGLIAVWPVLVKCSVISHTARGNKAGEEPQGTVFLSLYRGRLPQGCFSSISIVPVEHRTLILTLPLGTAADFCVGP